MATKELEDLLDSILNEIEPDLVPGEFVEAACVTDLDGDVYVISREELEDIMLAKEPLEDQGISEIGLILNLEEIKDTVARYSEEILKNIAR